jgi:hypothetical protein
MSNDFDTDVANLPATDVANLPAQVRSPGLNVRYPDLTRPPEVRDPADISDLAPDLRKIGECISGILKSISGVQDVRLGALRNRIRVFAIIGYDIVDQAGAFWTVEFALWNSPGTGAIYEEAYALGLAVSDKPLLQDDIETSWKMECNAEGFLQTGPVLSPDK